MTRQQPQRVAADTYLIRHAVQSSLGDSLSAGLHSLLIRGAEPVLVDFGMATNQSAWFEDVLDLVDAEDVRWLYVTHDDDDHSGNLPEALKRFPNAKVVVSTASCWRTSVVFDIPPSQMQTLDDGETLDAGDRQLLAIRPPAFDSPYTRGVFDSSTRLYYGVDAFCTPMPADPVDHVDDIPPATWKEGMTIFHHRSVSAWLSMVNPAAFQEQVSKVAALRPEVIVASHTPMISGSAIGRALEHMAELPSLIPTPREQTPR